jgi:LacI family transcriptional regulator
MSISRRTTLADIARRAGVHVTTVSMALRDHPRLPEATRQRLQTLAREMGYQKDPMLQALASYRGQVMARRHPPTLAYLTNWDTKLGWQQNIAHPEFFAGATAKATELGFKLDHFWMGEPGLSHERMSRILTARGITGLIIASHRRDTDVALHFDWSRFSAVKIDYLPHQPQLHNVTNDQCSIVRMAVQRARSLGYRRIGCVLHRGWNHAVDQLGSAGFLTEQAQFDSADHVPLHLFPEPEPAEAWLMEIEVDAVAPTAPLATWLEAHRPEVIISKRSFVAPALAELGQRVPEDVALIDLFLDVFDGSVAGVRQNHHAVGELAVELLAGQLHHHKHGVPEIPTTTYVEGTWFDGATCPARGVIC